MPETIQKIKEANDAVKSVIEQITNSQLDDTETFLKKLNKRMDSGSNAVDLAGTLNLGGIGSSTFRSMPNGIISTASLDDLAARGDKANKSVVNDAGIQREIKKAQSDVLNAFDAVSDYVASVGPEAALTQENSQLMVLLSSYEAQSSRLKKLFDANIAFNADSSLATALNKSLSGISTNLKTVSDINFDDVQVDPDTLVSLTVLGDKVKYLTEVLPKARNIAEHNRIVTKIDELRTRTEIVKMDMQLGDNNRKQFKLKELISQAGDDFSFGDNFFKE
jgi:hypothetical protein